MLVEAKWNVKDASGWHSAGEVFETEQDLADAVEVLNASKKVSPRKEEPVPECAEPEKQEEKTAKPRSTTRRKVSK